MSPFLKSLMTMAAVSLPGTASAQSSDALYCKALVDKYEHYLDLGLRFGDQPQSLQSKVSLAECQAGDGRGIPGLEQALLDAKLDLPARGAAQEAPKATASDNCGPETWSTDKMMYVGVPCQHGTTYENPAGASR